MYPKKFANRHDWLEFRRSRHAVVDKTRRFRSPLSIGSDTMRCQKCVHYFVQYCSCVTTCWGRMMVSSGRPLTSAKRRSTRSSEEEIQKNIGWTFLTNHAHVLLSVFRNPDRRLRDVAVEVGITERMVQRIVMELVKAGYLKVSKEGRRNRYMVHSRLRLRHPLETQHTIGELLELLT